MLNGTVTDCIDVVYTAVLSNRRQAETLLTRYQIVRRGTALTLTVVRQTAADNETMARDAINNVWLSRDIAWIYRDPTTREYLDASDAKRRPFMQVFVYDKSGNSKFSFTDGTPAPVNGFDPVTGSIVAPTFDRATGRLTFLNALGGQVLVDPQNGTVTFAGVAPSVADRVVLAYTPQTLRLNVTRDESGVVLAPTGWTSDPGFAPKPHVAASGANSAPIAFLDRSTNPRTAYVITGSVPASPATVSRMWLLYRKTNSNVTSPSGVYYKTMRLMVRLPRGVLRNSNGTLSGNISVTGNVGPVEVDWIRGRLYFTELDEGTIVSVTQKILTPAGSKVDLSASYRVGWGDEISVAVKPGDQSSSEVALPADSAVNEGQVSAFPDPYQGRVWVLWASTRAGLSDLFYMTLSPNFYPQEL